MTVLHVVLPNDIDDPSTPTGGNVYDRRICDGLAGAGWSVREHPVAGAWPDPGPADSERLARVLGALPDHALVLVDGLIASAVPEVMAPQAGRLVLAVLVHAALGDRCERSRAPEAEALSGAAAILTTSRWSRARLIELYPHLAARIHAAPPGVDHARPATGSSAGSQLLCVAAVTRHKGYDVLVGALSMIADLSWRCVCVGALDRDPGFAGSLRERAGAAGLRGRITFDGPLVGAPLRDRYEAADLLVLPSRGETYGMVVTEALARGTPVLASAVGGVPEAIGTASDGRRPGLLVPPGDPEQLAGVLRRWLTEPDLRRDLRDAAHHRRATLSDWSVTSTIVSDVLSAATGTAAGTVAGSRARR